MRKSEVRNAEREGGEKKGEMKKRFESRREKRDGK
jgi:hypothetical protein